MKESAPTARSRSRLRSSRLDTYSFTISLGRDSRCSFLPKTSAAKRTGGGRLFPKLCKAVQGPPHACTHPKLRDVSCERLLCLKKMGPGRNLRMASICLIQARSVSHNSSRILNPERPRIVHNCSRPCAT